MTLQSYLRAIKERWVLVTLAVVLGVAAAVAVFFVRPVQYTAETSLYVSAQATGGTQEAFQAAQLSEQRVSSYTELATSPRVTMETIERLGLPYRPEQLAQKLTATSALNSIIINVSATDPSPAQAARIADTVGIVTAEAVYDLERQGGPGSPAPVSVRLVQPAPLPDSPSSPGLPITIFLGLAAGLVIGLGAAVARHSLDTSVSSREALRLASEAPNLGDIPYDARAAAGQFDQSGQRFSARAESFRQLRTNLQFVDVDRPRRVLLVTSSVQSEGKTTTVIDLALALSAAGHSVLAIDADLRRPHLADATGLESAVGLTSVLAGRMRMEAAVQTWQRSFDILPSGPQPPNPSELLASRQMRQLLDEARARYDFVVVDSPPLLPVTDAAAIAPSTDGALLVCRFKTTKTWQVARSAGALRAVSVEPLGTILTMAPESGGGEYGGYSAPAAAGLQVPPDQHREAVIAGHPSPRPRGSAAVPAHRRPTNPTEDDTEVTRTWPS
ncbi:capsular exopolysaccharide synthesis family protein [Actinomycetospora succinea]|uniref:non-specific protein-tyrosine kinase n=1 Tax=Actinomycetospora succinea TaxID=663603 RepID=A0A4R6UPD4_9PSEU|nr:polysaccharide biosynthesis tyrosine autokinase [Actinomycetospora succinea]TDQ48851.1 capsular exopolysaccharide synthesis family protein [Actinomycetospora succinea]